MPSGHNAEIPLQTEPATVMLRLRVVSGFMGDVRYKPTKRMSSGRHGAMMLLFSPKGNSVWSEARTISSVRASFAFCKCSAGVHRCGDDSFSNKESANYRSSRAISAAITSPCGRSRMPPDRYIAYTPVRGYCKKVIAAYGRSERSLNLRLRIYLSAAERLV